MPDSPPAGLFLCAGGKLAGMKLQFSAMMLIGPDPSTMMLILAGAIVLLKLSGKSEFKWLEANFSTDSAWAVFALFTVAHAYTGLLVLRSSHRLESMPRSPSG